MKGKRERKGKCGEGEGERERERGRGEGRGKDIVMTPLISKNHTSNYFVRA